MEEERRAEMVEHERVTENRDTERERQTCLKKEGGDGGASAYRGRLWSSKQQQQQQ